jgi:hypothetical protein
LTGTLRSGYSATAAELSDCLTVLQDMLDAWSAERLVVYALPYTTTDQNGVTLSLKANQQKYKLGNLNGNEDFLMPRPPKIDNVSVIYTASPQTPVEIGMDMYNVKQWQAIPNKSTPSLLPQICYVEPTTDATDWLLYFWPIPTQAQPIVIYPWAALNQFPNLQAKFAMPPAYIKAIRYNLAVDLAAEFSTDLQKFPVVTQIATTSKNVIKAINLSMNFPEVWCDEALIGTHARGNIFAGGPNRNRSN